MKLPAYCINLKQSKKRLDDLLLDIAGITHFDIKIIQAFNGHDPEFPFHEYRDYANIFWGRRQKQNDFKPAAFCCYLSHEKCWKTFLKDSDSKYAFIFEDDISINRNNLNSFINSSLPKDFDIIYINDRITNWTNFSTQPNVDIFLTTSSLLRDITINHSFINMIPDNGADGYIISRAGAKKLLQMVKIRGICMDIDFAMILNSLIKKDIKKIKQNKKPSPKVLQLFLEKLEISNSTIEDVLLTSYIYYKPITSLRNTPSDIQHNIFISRDIFNPI